jgi:hypothetical protein
MQEFAKEAEQRAPDSGISVPTEQSDKPMLDTLYTIVMYILLRDVDHCSRGGAEAS